LNALSSVTNYESSHFGSNVLDHDNNNYDARQRGQRSEEKEYIWKGLIDPSPHQYGERSGDLSWQFGGLPVPKISGSSQFGSNVSDHDNNNYDARRRGQRSEEKEEMGLKDSAFLISLKKIINMDKDFIKNPENVEKQHNLSQADTYPDKGRILTNDEQERLILKIDTNKNNQFNIEKDFVFMDNQVTSSGVLRILNATTKKLLAFCAITRNYLCLPFAISPDDVRKTLKDRDCILYRDLDDFASRIVHSRSSNTGSARFQTNTKVSIGASKSMLESEEKKPVQKNQVRLQMDLKKKMKLKKAKAI
jgi:hypothetical protein